MINQLAEYEYLWTSDVDTYCLIKVSDTEDEFVIYNRRSKTAIVIEDDRLYGQVIRMMISRGVLITNTIP